MKKTAYGSLFVHVVLPFRLRLQGNQFVWSTALRPACSFTLPAQISRIMRLLVFCLFAAFLSAQATGTAQNVSISGKNLTLQKVLSAIEKQTGYVTLANKPDLAEAKTISLYVFDMPLTNLLEVVFKDQPLEYTVKGKTIFLSRKIPVPFLGSTDKDPSLVEFLAQPVPLTGSVKGADGVALEGASIRIKGTQRGTASGADGRFSIDVSPNQVLQVSFTGYVTQEVTVTEALIKAGMLIIKLQPNDGDLGEVIISTGMFQKADKSYTGSSITVSAEQLRTFGNRNLITSLRNIDPGFVILENNISGSDPNQLPDVQIRGNSSLPNIDNLDDLVGLNTPLVILDGFQSTLERLLDINVNEVESLTILKDASATAIYGSRGANGVIVITTRLPKPGALRISYRGEANMEVADLSGYDLLNAGEKLDLEKSVGLYNNSIIEQDINLKKYYNYLLNEVNAGVNTDWLRAPLRVGAGQRHNLNFSGGVSSFRYSASAQINNIAGVMKGSKRSTFNGNINLSYQLKNIKFSNQTILTEGRFTESQYGSFSEYARMNPYFRAYDADGNVLKTLGDPGENYYVVRWNTLPTNPLHNASLNGFNKTKNSEVVNNTSIEWSVTQALMLRARLGLGKVTRQQDVYRPADHTDFANYTQPGDIFRKGSYNYNINNGFNYDGAVNLQYSKRFNQKHLVFSGLDFNIRHQENSLYGFMVEGFTNPRFDYISMALQYAQGQKPTGAESAVNAMGITANVNYMYDDRYFTDLSIRFDGSSQFGANNRMAPFWSLGFGWNLHNEDFLNKSPVVDRLKLRGSVGTTGSQNFSAYQALSTYRYYTDRRYYNLNGAYLLGLGNEDLKWQQTSNYDIGFDGEFLGSRLKLTGDYYYSLTKDLVSSISIPASTGFTSYVENIGEMKNQGFELRATGVLTDQGRKGWYASVTAGVAQNRNKIVAISQALKDAQKSRQLSAEATPSSLYVEGYSTNTIWVVPSLGIDPSNGKEVYLDANGLPTYEWSGANLRAMGNTDPTYMGNFSFQVRYKGFTFNTSFGYRLGGQLYNQTLISKVENADYRYNVDRRVYEDRWVQPGDVVQFKGRMVTGTTYKTSRFVQDENTLICQNIFLQYNLMSAGTLKKLHMQQLQLTANVDQPFRVSSIRQERGIAYPFSRMFSFGISATF